MLIHFSIIEDFCLSLDGSVLYSVSQDSSLKIYNFSEKKQVRSTNICDLALSSCELSPNGKVVIVGSWDNNIYTYSIEYGSVLETVPAHDDAVSCLFLQGNILVSGSWDATVKLWEFRTHNNSVYKIPIAVFIDHETAVHSVTLDSKANLCASGTAEGTVSIFDVKSKSMLRSLPLHTASVSCLQFMPDSSRLLSCSLDGHLRMTDAHTGVEIFVAPVGTELQYKTKKRNKKKCIKINFDFFVVCVFFKLFSNGWKFLFGWRRRWNFEGLGFEIWIGNETNCNAFERTNFLLGCFKGWKNNCSWMSIWFVFVV